MAANSGENLPPDDERIYLAAERNFPTGGNEEPAGAMYRKALGVGEIALAEYAKCKGQLIGPADAGPRGSMRLLYGDDDAAASMMNGVEQQAIKVAALLLARIFGNIEQGEF